MVQAQKMKERVREILRENNAEKIEVAVAVLDSGFDSDLSPHFHSNGTLPVKKFEAQAGSGDYQFQTQTVELAKDEVGHGVSVTGLIAAKGKIGMLDGGNSLAVYEGTLNTGGRCGLPKQLEKVCEENQDPDGITVINLSGGHASDEYRIPFLTTVLIGLENGRDEEHCTKEISALANKGCLAVVAAGNGGYRGHHVNQLDDAYLRVEAVGKDRQLTSFSSVGEVAAPGEDVFTTSNGNLNLIWNSPPCHQQPSQGDSIEMQCDAYAGTSFAAPIVTGIAAQVVKVLKSGDGYFQKLSNSERISLVTRIIKHSEVNGVVNGLNAVEIADSWNKISSQNKGPLKLKWVNSI
jgi:subtilisin family serine protease